MSSSTSLNTCVLCQENTLLFQPQTKNSERSYARCCNCQFTIFIPRKINHKLIKQLERATLSEEKNLIDMGLYHRVIMHPDNKPPIRAKCFSCKNMLIATRCNSKNENKKGNLRCPYCKINMFMHPGYFEISMFQ